MFRASKAQALQNPTSSTTKNGGERTEKNEAEQKGSQQPIFLL